jgi:hypothetical protein
MTPESYMTPQSELLTLLIDHWPLNTGLAAMITKLTDTEVIALHKAVTSYAGFVVDMSKEQFPSTAGVL